MSLYETVQQETDELERYLDEQVAVCDIRLDNGCHTEPALVNVIEKMYQSLIVSATSTLREEAIERKLDPRKKLDHVQLDALAREITMVMTTNALELLFRTGVAWAKAGKELTMCDCKEKD